MGNIILPLDAVIDAESRRVIRELKAKIGSLESDIQEANYRASIAEERLARYEDEIAKLEKLKEVFKEPVEELAEFLGIDLCDSDWC